MAKMQHKYAVGQLPDEGRDCSALLGTPFKVILHNGVSECIDPKSGKACIDVTDLPGLIGIIVQARVLSDWKMSGADLKYIRSALCIKSMDIANLIDATPEYYSRCESGKNVLSDEKEKIYRMLVFMISYFNGQNCKIEVSKEIILNMFLSCKKSENISKLMKSIGSIFFGLDIKRAHSSDDNLELHFCRQYKCSEQDSGAHLNELNGCPEEWNSEILDRLAA